MTKTVLNYDRSAPPSRKWRRRLYASLVIAALLGMLRFAAASRKYEVVFSHEQINNPMIEKDHFFAGGLMRGKFGLIYRWNRDEGHGVDNMTIPTNPISWKSEHWPIGCSFMEYRKQTMRGGTHWFYIDVYGLSLLWLLVAAFSLYKSWSTAPRLPVGAPSSDGRDEAADFAEGA